MSGFFGIFNRNGKAVDKQVVKTMLDDMSYWEPDERNLWVDGSVALGHVMLWNTPESKYEHLPLEKDAYVLTMDARIDNRDELAKEITLPDKPMFKIGDSEFILGAYKKWGEECPKHLLGDFAFVIWDNEKQQLYCARDHVGIKSFYYYVDGDKFVFANDIRGVISHPGFAKSVNNEAIAIYLDIGELWDRKKTFYTSVQKLPPAMTLIVTQDEIKEKEYWKAEESPKIRFLSEQEYVAALSTLLYDAVKKRVRTEYPVGSHLSGGFDSSTIATIAARYLRMKDRILNAYSWVHPPQNDEEIKHYEWSNSTQVSELENMELSHIDLSAEKLCDILMEHDILLNDTTDLFYEFVVREEAKKKKIHTILSGWGGDELLTYRARAYIPSLLQQRNFLSALKEIYIKSKQHNRFFKSFLSQIYHKIFVPVIPSLFHCRLPKIICENEPQNEYLTESFSKKVKGYVMPHTTFTMCSVRQDQLDLFYQGHILNRLESWASSGFKARIEYVYPLLDKRIVEFALGLPPELYYQQGMSRYLARLVTEGILPDEIRFGDFKDEANRVSKLNEISINAVKLWLKGQENITRNDSDYINFETLKKSIQSIENVSTERKKTFLERLDIVYQSILVLSLR